MNKICLFGASGHGKVVKDVAESINMVVEAFIDDHPKSKFLHETPIVSSAEMTAYTANKFIISIGNNKIRKIISQKLTNDFATLVHKTATISPTATIEEGTVIMNGTNINSDANIGKHTIINTAAVIEHDCIIGDFVHISPNASLAGGVIIGECTHVGVGALVIENINIGKNCIIGAGAVVIRDVADGTTVVGNPAKPIKLI